VTLEASWEREAAKWIAWARAPGHDSYWYYREGFLALLPPPGRAVLDLACGEGRLTRDLAAAGYSVTGVDSSPSLVEAAREADPAGKYVLADAADLPFDDDCFDLVVAYNSLMDVDSMPAAVSESARVLTAGGHLCFAIVHPLNSAGAFEDGTSESPFVIEGSYLAERRYAETLERSGFEMTFHSIHRPLEAYARELEEAGFLIEAIREPGAPSEVSRTWGPEGVARWGRLPCFLWLRAVRP
jgi:ubiquinone/menaquinone biosynthesis C-methylase UbiE